MERTSPASSAVTLDNETIDLVLERSKKVAFERAGKQEAKVSDIAGLQRTAYEEILMNAQGSDGANAAPHAEFSDQTISALDQSIQRDQVQRMSAIAPTPDAYVLQRTDETVGLQHDGDRSVGIADEVLDDAKLSARVSAHEGEHRNQEVGSPVAEVPEIGDPTLDVSGTIDRLAFRENAAIAAEGGLAGHTKEYYGFVEKSHAVATYLDANGEEGKKLVKEAGRTNAGFATLHQKIVTTATRRKMLEQLRQESMLAA